MFSSFISSFLLLNSALAVVIQNPVDETFSSVFKRQSSETYRPRQFTIDVSKLGLGSGIVKLKASEGFSQRHLNQQWANLRTEPDSPISSYISDTTIDFQPDPACTSLPNYVYGVNNVKQFQLISKAAVTILQYQNGASLPQPTVAKPLVVIVEQVPLPSVNMGNLPSLRIVHFGRGGLGCINNQADHLARDLNSITGTVDISSLGVPTALYNMPLQFTPYMGMTTTLNNLTPPITVSGPAECASHCADLSTCGGFTFSLDSTTVPAKQICQYRDIALQSANTASFTPASRINLFVKPPKQV